jgi:SAM-dependent methyltransferase
MAEYDAIGDRYSEAKLAPWRLHLEAYSLERLAGDLRGARVLDLACGDGFYTRRFMRRGAALALGIDLSAEMVALARDAERDAPLGCRYQIGDAAAAGRLGEFDLVNVAYLLNYARTRDELRRFCETAAINLRPGGRLIGVNDYTADAGVAAHDYPAHGFRKRGPDAAQEGQPVVWTFDLPAGRSFSITNYDWHPDTYLQALRDSGLREAAWQPLTLSPDAGGFPDGFWAAFLDDPPSAALSAVR